MKRIEKWIISLIILHFILLITFQWVMLHTQLGYFLQPVYEYIGVYKGNTPKMIETIDHLFQNVVSF